MKDTKKIIRELVEEVIEEMTGTAAVGGSTADVAAGKSAGPIKSPNWGRKKTKGAESVKSLDGYTVVPGHDEKSTVEEDEQTIVRRDLNIMEARSRYRNFRDSDMMKNHAKISYGI
jgi:hypothetical protein